jgi:hypothetical protein
MMRATFPGPGLPESVSPKPAASGNLLCRACILRCFHSPSRVKKKYCHGQGVYSRTRGFDHHGVYEWEKGIRQKLCFDLEMGFDNRPAAATDDINLALDYATLSRKICDHARAR